MTDVTAASSSGRWWLQDEHREQFDAASREGGQMSPRSWQNRPDEGERFGKFLAGLNPLHHIPGVNLVYRELTGEKLEPGQQVLGGALFGGVFGLVAGLFNAAVSNTTGKDIVASIRGIFESDDKPAAVASAAPLPQAAAPLPQAIAPLPQATATGTAPPPAAATPASAARIEARPRAGAPAAPAEVVVPLGAHGRLPDVLDLDAIAPAAGPSAPPAPAKPTAVAPVAAPPAAPGNAAMNVAAVDERRWFPARGRENPRAINTTVPPTPPAVMSLQNARAEGRIGAGLPGGVAPTQGLPVNSALPAGMPPLPSMPVSTRAGAGAYGSALELSRELQKHYLGTQ